MVKKSKPNKDEVEGGNVHTVEPKTYNGYDKTKLKKEIIFSIEVGTSFSYLELGMLF